MKKKYIILIVITLLLLLIGGYLGYKIYYVNYYDLSHIENFEKSKETFVVNEDRITIKNIKLNEEEYFIYKNMKIRNILSNFEMLSNTDDFNHTAISDSISYILKDDNTNNQIAYINLSRGMTQLELYIDTISNDTRAGFTDDIKNYLKDKKITNDIELYKFLYETRNNKNNIFDSISDMKNFYSLHQLFRSGFDKGITIIDGDYKGYMINHNLGELNIKEYNILKGGKRYTLTFNGLEYFTEEKIQDLLNTLVIE